MKKIGLFFILFLYFVRLVGQNTAPEVIITEIEHFSETHTLILHYDVSDPSDDDVTVFLQENINATYYNNAEAEGDVGTGINPGQGKQIVYNYQEGLKLSDIQLRIFAYNNQEIDISEMIDEVSIESLKENMDTIIGIRHYTSNPEHMSYVEDLLDMYIKDYGLSTHHHHFKYGSKEYPNFIGRLSGLNNKNLCIIGAHFDTVHNAPGADDNGSGMIAVMEAIKIMSNHLFENNIQFIFFNLEELGLLGSRAYVKDGIESDENIIGLINFDMIGYYSDEPNSQTLPAGFEILFPEIAAELSENEYRADFILNAAAQGSYDFQNLYIETAEEYVPELKIGKLVLPGNGQIASDLRRSDHAPFWDKGYPALFLTDGAETRNPHYHRPGDVIETLDFEFIANITKASIAALARIAGPLNGTVTDVDLSDFTSSTKQAFLKDLKLWPNPAENELNFTTGNTIKSGTIQIEINDLKGIKHLEITRTKTDTDTQTLNISDLSPGQYFITVRDGKNIYSAGFVKGK